MTEAVQTFAVRGTERSSGKEVSILVRETSLSVVGKYMAKRGVTINRVEADTGEVYIPYGDGFRLRERTEPVSGPATEPVIAEHFDPSATHNFTNDQGGYALCVFIPVIGILAAAIRVAHREKGAGELVGAALLGVLLWTIAIWAAIKGIAQLQENYYL